MLDFLTEEVKNELVEVERGLTWTRRDENRAKRWDHMFNPALFEGQEDVQASVDMSKDPVLDHYKMSAADRVRLRWETEFLMDNMVAYAHESEAGQGVLTETTSSTAIAAFTTWALPMVRKYLPRQFLRQIVPSYPMSQPTGKLFTADTTYGSGGTYASGTSIYDSFDPTYAADQGECAAPHELNFTVTDTDITAISKKLKGVWSIEAAQNLQSYHRLVMENEVIRSLGEQINREIDRYGINALVAGATTTTYWNSTQPMAAANGWSNATPRQYNESLWDAIEDANRAIKDSKYVNGNFLLCGTTFASRLRKLNGFRLAHSNDEVEADVVTGPNLFGTLNGRYRLYEDVDFAADKCLIGHKPSSWKYTGAALSMYVPVWRTPIIHTTTMCPGVGYLSRFAFTVVDGDFYGMIIVS